MSRRKAKPSDLSLEARWAIADLEAFRARRLRDQRSREATQLWLTICAAVVGTVLAVAFALHAGGVI